MFGAPACNHSAGRQVCSWNACIHETRLLAEHLKSALAISCQSIEGALGLPQRQASARGDVSHSHAASQALHRILHSLPRLPGNLQGLQLPQPRGLPCRWPCTNERRILSIWEVYSIVAISPDMLEGSWVYQQAVSSRCQKCKACLSIEASLCGERWGSTPGVSQPSAACCARVLIPPALRLAVALERRNCGGKECLRAQADDLSDGCCLWRCSRLLEML